LKELLIIGTGGFIGAICRYIINSIFLTKFGLPIGTFVVNLLGSFIVGFVMYSSVLINIPMEYRLLLITGFCGALTTFSTFSYESFLLVENGENFKFITNIIINVFGCLIMVFIGRYIALSIFK